MTADAIGGNLAADIIEKENKAILNKLAPFKKIIEHLSAIGFSSIDDYMSVADGGEITAIPFDNIVKKKLRAIESVEENTKITESDDGSHIYKDSKIKYKLYNKLDAIKYLVKLRGDEPAEKHEIICPEQMQYTTEERKMLKDIAILQAKEELKRLRGE